MQQKPCLSRHYDHCQTETESDEPQQSHVVFQLSPSKPSKPFKLSKLRLDKMKLPRCACYRGFPTVPPLGTCLIRP